MACTALTFSHKNFFACPLILTFLCEVVKEEVIPSRKNEISESISEKVTSASSRNRNGNIFCTRMHQKRRETAFKNVLQFLTFGRKWLLGIQFLSQKSGSN